MTKTSSQQIHAILTDPCSSHWLKHALETAVQRDILDAMRDAAALLSILTARHGEATMPDQLALGELEAVKRIWYDGAKKDGILGMIATVCREHGEHLNATYGPKYKHHVGDIEIYLDDYGCYMTVKTPEGQVCSTHSNDRLFVPGDWVTAVLSEFPDALDAARTKNLKAQRDAAGKLARELRLCD